MRAALGRFGAVQGALLRTKSALATFESAADARRAVAEYAGAWKLKLVADDPAGSPSPGAVRGRASRDAKQRACTARSLRKGPNTQARRARRGGPRVLLEAARPRPMADVRAAL